MDFMSLGKKARRSSWKPSEKVSRDEYDMENVDDFFDNTQQGTPQKNIQTAEVFTTPQNDPSMSISDNGERMESHHLLGNDNNELLDHIPHSNIYSRVDSDDKTSQNEGSQKLEQYKTNYELASESSSDGASSTREYSDDEASAGGSMPRSSESEKTHSVRHTIDESVIDDVTDDLSDSLPNESEIIDSEYSDSDKEYVPSPKHRKLPPGIDHQPDVGKSIRGGSKRIRVPPLDYWKNEKIVYKRSSAGNSLNIDKIVTFINNNNDTKSRNKPCRSQTSTKSTLQRKHPHKKASLSNEEIILTPHLNEASSRQSGNLIIMDPGVHKARTSVHDDQNNYILDTLFDDQVNCKSGLLRLKGGSVKSKANVGGCCVIFHITSGVVTVIVDQNCFTCGVGATFQIPAYADFEILNHGNGTAELFFVQVNASSAEAMSDTDSNADTGPSSPVT